MMPVTNDIKYLFLSHRQKGSNKLECLPQAEAFQDRSLV
jgi:hypothetical protein